MFQSLLSKARQWFLLQYAIKVTRNGETIIDSVVSTHDTKESVLKDTEHYIRSEMLNSEGKCLISVKRIR